MYVWNQQTLVVFIHANGIRYAINYWVSYWKANEWHHIKVEHKSDKANLIVDGVKRGSKTLNSVAYNTLRNIVFDMHIGGNGTHNWGGVVDKLRVQ